MSDEQWLSTSHERFESIRASFPGSVESFCEAGDIRSSLGDDGAAAYFYLKSLDLMHTNYIFNRMQSRKPSPRDAAPIDGYTKTLRRVRETRPSAPIAQQVRTTTHLLRTMSTVAERQSLPSDIYHQGLEELAEIAPDVDVSDVFWEPFGG